MEQNFQTSFIPKKPIIEERETSTRSVGFLAVISIFILFAVSLSTGALFFYQKILERNITQLESNLNLAKSRFEPTRITELQVLDKRLRSSTEILSKHIAITPIFEILQAVTMKTVRFTKFGYELGTEEGGKILVKMNGVAVGYRSVALQADLFTENKNLIDPVFSNLTLDDRGNVMFNLDFSVDPSLVDYKQMLLRKSQ